MCFLKNLLFQLLSHAIIYFFNYCLILGWLFIVSLLKNKKLSNHKDEYNPRCHLILLSTLYIFIAITRFLNYESCLSNYSHLGILSISPLCKRKFNYTRSFFRKIFSILYSTLFLRHRQVFFFNTPVE